MLIFVNLRLTFVSSSSGGAMEKCCEGWCQVARVPPRVDSVGDQHLLGSVFTGAGAAVKEMDLGVKWTPWTASRTPRELVLF